MKKIISILLALALSMASLMLASGEQNSDVYDYSSFIGVWHKIDPDQLNGDVPLEIVSVKDNREIVFCLDDSNYVSGIIENNQVKWTEEWHDGSMGLTLTFNDDNIRLDYSRYSWEWYSEIIFVSDVIKPRKISTNGDITVILNGNPIQFDQPPVLKDDRTLVPIRAIAEAFEAEVDWNAGKQTVFINFNKANTGNRNSILLNFVENEFENEPIKIQGNMYANIVEDDTYIVSTLTMRHYKLIDIDADGQNELVVSADHDAEEVYGTCFSVWECNDDGTVTPVLATIGNQSRDAYRYFIIRYNGKIFMLESTGSTSSGGKSSVRNLYSLSNGKFELSESMKYNSWEASAEYTINGEKFSAEYVERYIKDFDNNTEFIFRQYE